MGAHRVLEAGEERALLRAAKLTGRELRAADWEILDRLGVSRTGTKASARDTMIRMNMRLVLNISMIFRDHFHRIPRLDLIYTGRDGLAKAVDDFDLKQTVRFGTYATWKIRQAMQQRIFNEAFVARIPAYRLEAFRRWVTIQTQVETKLGRPPTFEESAAELRAQVIAKLTEELEREPEEEEISDRLPKDFEDPPAFLREMRKVARHINVGLDSQRGPDPGTSDDRPMGIHSAADAEAEDPFRALLQDSYALAIAQALGQEPLPKGTSAPLRPREAHIILMRFALWKPGGLFTILRNRFTGQAITPDDIEFFGEFFGIKAGDLVEITEANSALAEGIAAVFATTQEPDPDDPLGLNGMTRLGTLFLRTPAQIEKRELSPMTLGQIGYLLGITKERVRQIESRGKQNLGEWIISQVGAYDPDED